MKGCLVKKNWYGNKQLREFHLLNSGEIRYFAVQGDKLNYKGSLWLGPKAKVAKTDHLTLNIFCHEKQRPYILMQPDSSKVNYNEQKKKGNNCFIIEWHTQITKLQEKILKQHEILNRDAGDDAKLTKK